MAFSFDKRYRDTLSKIKVLEATRSSVLGLLHGAIDTLSRKKDHSLSLLNSKQKPRQTQNLIKSAANGNLQSIFNNVTNSEGEEIQEGQDDQGDQGDQAGEGSSGLRMRLSAYPQGRRAYRGRKTSHIHIDEKFNAASVIVYQDEPFVEEEYMEEVVQTDMTYIQELISLLGKLDVERNELLLLSTQKGAYGWKEGRNGTMRHEDMERQVDTDLTLRNKGVLDAPWDSYYNASPR